VRLGKRLVNGWLKAPDVFHWHVLCLAVAGLQVLVQGGEYLRVQNLKTTDAVHHALQLDPLDVVILAVHPLDPEDVIAKVETLEPPLLTE